MSTYEKDNSVTHTCNGSIEAVTGAEGGKPAHYNVREVWNHTTGILYVKYSDSTPSSVDEMRQVPSGQPYIQDKNSAMCTGQLYVQGTNTEKILYIEA